VSDNLRNGVELVKGFIDYYMEPLIKQYGKVSDWDHKSCKVPEDIKQYKEELYAVRRALTFIGKDIEEVSAGHVIDETPDCPAKDVKETHPSFGTLEVGNPTGGSGKFFGSAIEHQHYKSIRISRAQLTRDAYGDSIFSGRELLEVNLTYDQWARFVSSHSGRPTPCTISHFNGQTYKLPEVDSGLQKHTTDFENQISKLSEYMVQARLHADEKLKAKGPISKGDRLAVSDNIHRMVQHLSKGIPYLLETYSEKMEAMQTEAKIDVESYVGKVLEDAGLQAIENGTYVPTFKGLEKDA
jgi:hypothetical protein